MTLVHTLWTRLWAHTYFFLVLFGFRVYTSTRAYRSRPEVSVWDRIEFVPFVFAVVLSYNRYGVIFDRWNERAQEPRPFENRYVPSPRVHACYQTISRTCYNNVINLLRNAHVDTIVINTAKIAAEGRGANINEPHMMCKSQWRQRREPKSFWANNYCGPTRRRRRTNHRVRKRD